MKLNKHCYKCKTTKSLDCFCKSQWVCKLCHAERQRAYRRTLRGFLDQKYTAMSKRVRGKDRNCLKTVKGLPILPRNEFLNWAYNQPELATMFDRYKNSKFDFKLCPTIDRINPREGYIISNMRFLTQSENAKGSQWNNKGLTKNRPYQNLKARLNYRKRQEAKEAA